MLNQTILTGNLGQDVSIFYSSEGNPVATFSLAFRSSKKKTGWIKVVCFGKLAEVTEKPMLFLGSDQATLLIYHDKDSKNIHFEPLNGHFHG